jgi:hypothetical protein
MADRPDDLPEWSSGGNRRRLEERWLQALERWGIEAFLPEVPEQRPLALDQAIEQFNNGDFWDSHETLEAVWLETRYPLRLFYHALIKAAAGYHHASNHNRHGTTEKLKDAVRGLAVFPTEDMGIDSGRLRDEVSSWLAPIEAAARVDWATIDAQPRPRIHKVDC